MVRNYNNNEKTIIELINSIMLQDNGVIEKGVFIVEKNKNLINFYYNKFKKGDGFTKVKFSKLNLLKWRLEEILEWEGETVCSILGVRLYASLWQIVKKIVSDLQSKNADNQSFAI